MNWQKIIKREAKKAKTTYFTIGRKKYLYFIFPFESRISPSFQKAVVEGLSKLLNQELEKANAILTIEAKGFFPASWLAEKYKKDLIIVRKRDYKIKGQIKIKQKKAYGKGKLFCLGLKKNDRILIIEDIISSGGTLISVIKAIKNKCKIVGAGSVYERGEGKEKIEKETGIKVKTLARIEIKNKKPILVFKTFCYQTSLTIPLIRANSGIVFKKKIYELF